jgi:hypothetical protein
MERTLSTPTPFADLERFLAEDAPAPEPPAAPPERELPAASADDFDAQILAGLVSP